MILITRICLTTQGRRDIPRVVNSMSDRVENNRLLETNQSEKKGDGEVKRFCQGWEPVIGRENGPLLEGGEAKGG